MGQKRHVQVFVLVTDATIEENLLGTLAAKQELALAALDAESDVDTVDLASGMEELRNRLEVLLGAKPEAPLDASRSQNAHDEALRLARRDRVADAAGRMLAGAFELLGELVPATPVTPEAARIEEAVRSSLAECIEVDAAGRTRLTVTLPSASASATDGEPQVDALDALACSLARIAAARAADGSASP